MKNKTIYKLLDLYERINDVIRKTDEIFGDNNFLYQINDELGNIILEFYKIPEDTTVEFIKKYGENADKKEGYFCRDYFFDLLYDFGDGKITKKELENKLTNWK